MICRRAQAVLGVHGVGLFEYDGTLVHHRTSGGQYIDPVAYAAYRTGWPRVPGRDSLACRAILDGTIIHIRDMDAEPGVSETVRGLGNKTQISVPLMRDGHAIGALTTGSLKVDDISDTQIELLKTFAEQAVIAISSAETFRALQDRTAELTQSVAHAEAALSDLKRAQDRLVQSEKMASLGQLTAGIAHEIKNPLNFVNNFSELSIELLDELRNAVTHNQHDEIEDLTATLKSNLDKIAQHGRRADSIVKNMLLHSRASAGEARAVDLNATVEEALTLAYHGARAATSGFNITLERDFDPTAGPVELYPQEITRVLVNLFGNGFYAAGKRASEPGFDPILRVATSNLGDQVEIRVRDNGIGMTEAVKAKIFEPFFTTKPAGEGTGLGLSLSFDIIVKQHAGQITVASQINDFTEFTITLPRKMAAGAKQ